MASLPGAPGPLGYILPVAMRVPRACAGAVTTLALGFGLSACGASSSGAHHVPEVGHVPLVAGAQVIARSQQCDPGAHAYCAIQFVVYDRNYRTSNDFLLSERAELHRHGWTGANGDTGEESAADSPGHKLHLTYATANGDLDGLIFHWIQRPWPIWSALSSSIFSHAPALSLLLEDGNGAT